MHPVKDNQMSTVANTCSFDVEKELVITANEQPGLCNHVLHKEIISQARELDQLSLQ
jgi:hypothetical protein